MTTPIDAAEWIKAAPPGTMVYARQQTTIDAPWMTGFLASEHKWRVQGYGPNPDIELRCGAFEKARERAQALKPWSMRDFDKGAKRCMRAIRLWLNSGKRSSSYSVDCSRTAYYRT